MDRTDSWTLALAFPTGALAAFFIGDWSLAAAVTLGWLYLLVWAWVWGPVAILAWAAVSHMRAVYRRRKLDRELDAVFPELGDGDSPGSVRRRTPVSDRGEP